MRSHTRSRVKDLQLSRASKFEISWADRSDSIDVSMNGSAQVEVAVDTYFIVSSETFQKSGSNVNTSFNVQRVNTSKALELVRIYIGQTLITDQNNNAGTAQKLAFCNY